MKKILRERGVKIFSEKFFMKQKSTTQKHQPVDAILLWIIGILVVFGVIMVASAGTVYADIRYGDAYFFLKRQLLGIFVGACMLFVLSRVDYRSLKPWAVPAFLVSIGFLVALLIPGVGTNVYGATRWIDLGFASFQPSEMAKLAMILYFSAWLSARGVRAVSRFSEGFLPYATVVGMIGILLLLQPDMGTLMVMVSVSGAMFFVAGGSLRDITGSFFAGFVLFAMLVFGSEYRWDRLMTFLHPETDPQGIGYHIQQALIALGSGGMFGLGLGNSHQKFNYLPEPAGDSIFAIIGEELGMIGAGLLILVFLFFALRGYCVAVKSADDFGRFLAAGIVSWVSIQALINMSAITGLIPLTGVPLPFISYGGSSVVFLLAGMGILLSVSRGARD